MAPSRSALARSLVAAGGREEPRRRGARDYGSAAPLGWLLQVVATADTSRIQADIAGVFALRHAELSKARRASPYLGHWNADPDRDTCGSTDD